MTPELGHLALWLALGLSLALGVLPLVGAQRGRSDWMALARPGTIGLFWLVALSYACLTAAFVGFHFRIVRPERCSAFSQIEFAFLLIDSTSCSISGQIQTADRQRGG